jgi:hypothetical protein
MVVIVVDPILETSRGSGGLDAPDETFGDEHRESVVHRLERDRADLGPYDLGHTFRRDMGPPRHRSEDSESLGSDLETALTQELSRVSHTGRITQLLE